MKPPLAEAISEAFMRKSEALDDAVFKIAELEGVLHRIAVESHKDIPGSPAARLSQIRKMAMVALGKGHIA